MANGRKKYNADKLIDNLCANLVDAVGSDTEGILNARKLGIHESTPRKWRDRKMIPNSKIVAKACEVFERDPNSFYGIEKTAKTGISINEGLIEMFPEIAGHIEVLNAAIDTKNGELVISVMKSILGAMGKKEAEQRDGKQRIR